MVSSIVSTLASLSLWLVLVLIVWSYIPNKRKTQIHFAISVAALVSAILNTALIIGGERSSLLTLLILALCVVSYTNFNESVRSKKRPP